MLLKRIKKEAVTQCISILETGNTGLLKGLLSRKDFFAVMEDLKDPAKKEACSRTRP